MYFMWRKFEQKVEFRSNMDQNKLLELASYVTNLKMFPYFDAAHYVVMCLLVRDDSSAPEHPGNFRRNQCSAAL